MNSKNKLSLGIFAATALVWLIAPLYGSTSMAFSPIELNALDILRNSGNSDLSDWLVVLAPIAAVVLGILGIFKNAGLSKVGGFVGIGGLLLSILIDMETLQITCWGFWALFVLMIANLAVCFMPER